MNDTLTPRDAARVLAEASSYEASLQQRTEGITQMLYAMVGPGIFLSYAYAERVDGFPDWGWSVLWLPWILAAGMTTGALWRSVALAAPKMKDPITPVGYLARFVGLVLLLGLVFALWDPQHYASPLFVIGGMYVVFGLLNPWHLSPFGRKVAGATGLVLLAAAAALAALPESGSGFVAAVVVSGLAPLLGGYVQAMRG